MACISSLELLPIMGTETPTAVYDAWQITLDLFLHCGGGNKHPYSSPHLLGCLFRVTPHLGDGNMYSSI